MNSFNQGIYYVNQVGILFKAIKKQINKCQFCEFYLNKKCNANSELFKLCDKIEQYYWIVYNVNKKKNDYLYMPLNINLQIKGNKQL